MILGDPGSGKSTLLKYLCIQITELRKKDHVLRNIIPVFFRLSDYSDYYKKHKKSIYEFVTQHFDIQYQDLFRENFEYSNLLLLMDGLDEITETSLRLKVTEQVMDLMARYPNNRYIVTSRIVGYQESKLGVDFSHFKLVPFTVDEIKLFTSKWYDSLARHTDKDFERAKHQAENLYDSISRNPSVLKLATNPLLMTIIALIHYQGKKLPSKRIELYDISTETFLEHWVQLRVTDEKQLQDKTEIIEILAPIAFGIHETKSNALIEESEFKDEFLKYFLEIHTNTTKVEAKKTCKEFIGFLRQQTGFFYEKGVDDDGSRFYGFMHLTFEEYLAAIEFVSKWSENQLILKDYIFQPRWTEIIRLAASQIRLSFKGKAGRTQTSNFLREILNVDDDFKDAQRPLQLACLIIADDVGISDELLNEISEKVFTLLSSSKFNSQIKSFCELFSELLLCDKRTYFIDKIKNLLGSENPQLLKNLTCILLACYEHQEVKMLLKDNINNNIIRDEAFKTDKINPIRNEDFFNNSIVNYLSVGNYNLSNPLEYWEISNLVYSYSGWYYIKGKENDFNLEKAVELLSKVRGKTRNNDLLVLILDQLILNGIREGDSFNFLNDFHKMYPNICTTNFREAVNKLDANDFKFSNHLKSCFVHLRNSKCILFQTDESISICAWTKEFKEFKRIYFKQDNLEKFITSLEKTWTKEDLETLKYEIYFINGPIKGRDNLRHFINSYESKKTEFYNFFDWELFPFQVIFENPEKLSEILLLNSQKFLLKRQKRNYNSQKSENDYYKLKIPSPVVLLERITSNRIYDTKLVNESLDYYNNCDEKYKEGVFEILYSILGLINVADNNLV